MGGIGQQQGRFQLVGDAPYPLGRLGGVQHGVKTAGGQRAQHRQQAGNLVVQVDGHRAALYMVLRQCRTDALHRQLYLAPGQGVALIPESRAVRQAGRGGVQ